MRKMFGIPRMESVFGSHDTTFATFMGSHPRQMPREDAASGRFSSVDRLAGFAHYVLTGMHANPQRQKILSGNETKIFDPRDSSTNNRGAELADPSLAERGEQWCLYLAGQSHGYGATDIFSATLTPGAKLSPNGWQPTRDVSGQAGGPPSPIVNLARFCRYGSNKAGAPSLPAFGKGG